MSAMCIDRPRGEVPEWNDAELDANASRSGDEGQYRRNGTANLFVFIDAHRPWRKVKVTDQRPAKDFAACMRDLVDITTPKPSGSGSYWTTCPLILPERSTRLFRPQTPIASWIASSSITRPSTQVGSTWSRSKSASCATSASTAASQTAPPWSASSLHGKKQRSNEEARTTWMFTTERARAKLARAYPVTAKES